MLTIRGLLTPAAGTTLLAALGLMTALGGGAAAVQLSASATSAATASPPAASAAAPAAAPVVQQVRVAAARTDGFDPATCVPQPVAAGTDAATGRTSTGEVQVTLVLPATTLIRVDDRGRPVSVSTNTGQAPCITDQFLRIGTNGLSTAADRALTTTVLSVQFGDGWAPGVQQVFPAA